LRVALHMTRAAHVLIVASIAIAGFAGTPAVDAATAQRAAGHATGLSCSLASATRVRSALGITVGPAQVTRNGPVTVCQFRSGTGLLVRFQTSVSASRFASGRKSFGQQGVSTKTIDGVGSKAYSSSIQGTNTIVVLQKTTELLITANAPQTKLVALAKLILPSL
jgi:hypothetical protein